MSDKPNRVSIRITERAMTNFGNTYTLCWFLKNKGAPIALPRLNINIKSDEVEAFRKISREWCPATRDTIFSWEPANER